MRAGRSKRACACAARSHPTPTLTQVVNPGGGTVARVYTPVNNEGAGVIELHIRMHDHGQMSGLVARMGVHSEVQARGPLSTPHTCGGRPDGCWTRLVLIAGGMAVTPMLQVRARGGGACDGAVLSTHRISAPWCRCCVTLDLFAPHGHTYDLV